VRETLDAIAAVRQAGSSGVKHRIEHAQLIAEPDLPRFSRLNVTASMQPIHATQDMRIAEQGWGRRCRTAYAWRDLLANGAELVFGSDAPIEKPDVLKGIHAAVTRRAPDGAPGPDGWIPHQCISVREAVQAYTAAPAAVTGEAESRGTITPGKHADLVVLSEDIFAIPPHEIRNVEVLATMLAGEFVYSRLA
jgi:predicted amidohydrolase YtcJ